MNFSGSKTIATMKNLFKSLMLVAVAAMALSACTEENNEVAAVAKKTIIEMTASLNADSRSGFMAKEDGSTTYKSEWHEGDKILVAQNGALSNNATVSIAKNGDFTAELNGEVAMVDVYSPASAWAVYETYAQAVLPSVQTPLANSVDPKAHILRCQGASVDSGTVNMTHEFAYGKMTVVAPEGVVIDHVKVVFKGDFYGAREQSLTLNADNVVDNVFWFATQPMTVESFTVTAYDANDKAYTKSVNVSESSNTLVFSYNKVKTFGVKDLVAEDIETEEPDEPEDINAPAFTEAYTSGNYYGDFYLNFLDDTLGVLTLNTYLMATSDWTLIEGTYGFAENVSAGTPSIYAGIYSKYNGTSLYGGTVKISIVNNQYEIYFSKLTDQKGNILLASAKYIGVIEGLLPNGGGDEPGGGEDPEQPGGGDEPVQPENPSNADGKTLETAYTFTTYTKQDDWGYPVMCLSGSEDNAVFEFESNSQSGYPTGLNAFNSGQWYTNWLKYEVNGTLIHCTYGSNQPSAIDLSKSYTWLERGGSGYTVEYIMIVLNNGDTVWYKFNGSFAF